MINRIVVTGDVFRRSIKNECFIQDGNIMWLYDILSPILKDVSGVDILLDKTSVSNSGFKSSEFISEKKECDYYYWVGNFNRSEFSHREINYTKKHYGQSFIVGFELSNFQKNLFKACDIPFLDLAIHPARFNDDYYFKVELNDRFDYGALDEYFIPEELILKNAQFFKAINRRGNKLKLNSESILFCGQVEEDASLIDRNYMVSRSMYHKDVIKLASQHKHLYYKPHPHSKNQKDTFDLIDRIPNASVINSDFYELIAKDEIKTVAAISSGTLYEAKLFNKKTLRLLSNSFDYDIFPAKAIDNSIFTGDFLFKILSKHFNVNKSYTNSPLSYKNPIKESLKVSWKSNVNGTVGIHSYPTIPLNEKISGSILHPFLLGDWAKENWGGWMLNQRQKLLFSTRNINSGDKLIINLRFLKKFHVIPKNIVDIFVNGTRVFNIKTRNIEYKLEIEINDNLVKRGYVEISFDNCEYKIPNDTLSNGDMRRIYIGINSIEMIEERKIEKINITNSKSTIRCNKVIKKKENICHFINVNSRNPLDIYMRLKFNSSNIGEISLSINNNAIRKFVYSDGEFIFNIEGFLGGDNRFDFNIRNENIDNLLIECIEFGSKYDFLDIAESFRSGVNIVGQVTVNTGMGVACRSAIKLIGGLIGASKVTPIQYNASKHLPKIENIPSSGYSNDIKKGIDLYLIPSPQIAEFFNHTKHHINFANYKIIWGAWELADIPSYLVQDHTFDEYWAMSEFIAEAVRRKTNKPVITMPLPVDFSYPEKKYSRAHFNIPENEFIFLYNYCADSTIARKNPLAAVMAFKKAFSKNEKVRLILKTKINQSQKNNIEEHEKIKKICENDKRITMLEGVFDTNEIKSLYLACDCYVSLHRSEGFGLTLAEAMGYGIPAIATGYSGNLEFMTNDNSCLVNYELVEVGGSYHGQLNQFWAEPDISEAAIYMQRIFSDDKFRDSISRRGMYDVHKKLSYLNISNMVKKQIKEMGL